MPHAHLPPPHTRPPLHNKRLRQRQHGHTRPDGKLPVKRRTGHPRHNHTLQTTPQRRHDQPPSARRCRHIDRAITRPCSGINGAPVGLISCSTWGIRVLPHTCRGVSVTGRASPRETVTVSTPRPPPPTPETNTPRPHAHSHTTVMASRVSPCAVSTAYPWCWRAVLAKEWVRACLVCAVSARRFAATP